VATTPICPSVHCLMMSRPKSMFRAGDQKWSNDKSIICSNVGVSFKSLLLLGK
jgi:hypothetical protein